MISEKENELNEILLKNKELKNQGSVIGALAFFCIGVIYAKKNIQIIDLNKDVYTLNIDKKEIIYSKTQFVKLEKYICKNVEN